VPSHRRIAITVLVLAASAGAATGITYATTATTTKVVYACANAHGTLKLLSNGQCPTGYSKVAINKRGPRGARGPKGDTGPAGPGTFTLKGVSTTTTVGSQQKAIPGMGLTARALCNASENGTQSSLYLFDDTASDDYTVVGSYNLSATGAHAFPAYQLSSHSNFPAGLGTIDFLQTKFLHANGEIVLQRDSSSGGLITGDVTVTRAGVVAVIHFLLYQGASNCLAQVDVTPAT
jgi:hypothetical protein